MSAHAAAFRAVVNARRTARAFDGARDVPAAVLRDVLAMTQRAPSSFNLQPWTCVIVRSPAQRELLGRAMLSASNASRVLDAPATAVFCADLEPSRSIDRLRCDAERSGRDARSVDDLALAVGYYATAGTVASLAKAVAAKALSPLVPAPEPTGAEAWAVKSAMLAASSYMLGATAHGLATAPMEGFVRGPRPLKRLRSARDSYFDPPAPPPQDAARIRAYLDVPDRYAIPLVVATGYAPPDDPPPDAPSPRLPPADIFFGDRFGAPLTEDSC